MLCSPRYIFHIWKIRHFLDCCEVWFVASSIAAVSDPKALVWILTWHLSAVVSISLHISEFWSVFSVEKEIFKWDASKGSGKLRRRPSLPRSTKVVRPEGVRLSVAVRKKNIYGFQQQYWHCVRRNNATLIRCRMKTEGTGLLQNNAYGRELVVFYLSIPCVHSLFMFYVYKKCK